MNRHTQHGNVVIRRSVGRSLLTIVFYLAFVGFYLYQSNFVIGTVGFVTGCLVVGLLIYEIFMLLRREIVLTIGSSGVYCNKFKFKQWDEILSIKKVKKPTSDSNIIYFVFQIVDSAEPYKVNVSDLDISPKKLEQVIRKHRDYNIYEIMEDEW
jgi:hypothetical protein